MGHDRVDQVKKLASEAGLEGKVGFLGGLGYRWLCCCSG